ncbi:MAG: hypothetical protein K6G89_07055 [Clostridia bacterium]|nr:hypothetical protein [Clostridia bacterium]
MAKGVYDKKRPTAKKVSSFDTKVIIIVSIAVVVLVLGIIALILIDTASKANVGKVNGANVSALDYRIFLSQVKAEMEADYEEEHKDDTETDSAAFWTAERIKEAEEKALENTREFYAEYDLAKEKGYGLTSEEVKNLSSSVFSMIATYGSYYSSMSNDQLLSYVVYSYCNMYCDNLKYEEMDKCVSFLGKMMAISSYRVAMQGDYKVEDLKYIDSDTEEVVSTGEKAIRDAYEENRDAYRRITLQALAIDKKGVDLPVKPDVVEEPVKPETTDETSAEYTEYKTKLEAYNKYLDDVKTYEENVVKYNELKAKVETMYTTLVANGKYTGKGIKAEDTPEYTDAELITIIAKEGAKYNDNMAADGTYTFSGTPSSTNLLAIFANSIEWTDDTRTGVKSTLVEKWAAKEETGETEESGETEADKKDDDDSFTDLWSKYGNNYNLSGVTEDGKFKESTLVLIEDGSYFYIVKVKAILDLDTSTEEAPEDASGSADLSVRANVINTVKTMTSYVDLKEAVKAAGAKYELKNRSDANIKTASDIVFAS